MLRIGLLVCIVALSGCTKPLDGDDYTLEASGAPQVVIAGMPFAFEMDVDGRATRATDHTGAHYWMTATDDPDGDFGQAVGCEHQTGEVPSEFTVTCTFAEPGTYYVRGHMRATEDASINFWTDEFAVRAVAPEGAYELTASALELTPTGASFQVTATGEATAFSDHLGAHFWTESTDDPNADFTASHGCAHQEGTLPDLWTVQCTLEPGTYYARGHARLNIGDAKQSYWTDEFEIVVPA